MRADFVERNRDHRHPQATRILGPRRWRTIHLGFGGLAVIVCLGMSVGAQPPAGTSAIAKDENGVETDIVATSHPESTVSPVGTLPRRHVLIVIGLPGDDEHEQSFRHTSDIWRNWLADRCGVKDEDITVLAGSAATDADGPATAEQIQRTASQLSDEVAADDSVWVFLLGHGSQDERHAWFHLPGPDLHDGQWSGLFAGLNAQQQVFWLTHSASGSFLKSMSRPNRIVITATDGSGEVNETRFPLALAEAMQHDRTKNAIDPSSDKESDSGTTRSVLDLFRATVKRVDFFFQENQLAPTEHAQLDDNGDGMGTELADLRDASDLAALADPSPAAIDGPVADRTIITLLPVTEAPTQQPNSDDVPDNPTKTPILQGP